MENSFKIVKIGKLVTLEKCDVKIEMSYNECQEYALLFSANLDDKEGEVYNKIESDLDDKLNQAKDIGDNSRRVIINYAPEVSKSDWCASMFHLLPREKENSILMVYQRSMLSDFFKSDVSFYAYLASKYNARLSVSIGSFHYLMGELK